MTTGTCTAMLDVFCPMHMIFDRDGIIRFCGPTAEKIVPGGLVGRGLFDIFEIRKPLEIKSTDALLNRAGERLKLQFRSAPHGQLFGVVMAGPALDHWTINLSFGISIVDAVREFKLTAADFAPTDLTVEMLYLVEAKSAAMQASRQLNERLQTARMEAEEQALTDTLTGLKNRRAMDQELSAAIASGDTYALMHVDLDFFKSVNDTLGHAAGDFVLLEVARIMLDETRDADTVARVGGDEFVILLKGAEDRKLIDRIAVRIIERLQLPLEYKGKECRISGSIGIVVSGDYKSPTADQLLGDADVALYKAKDNGRGCHLFFSLEMRATV